MRALRFMLRKEFTQIFRDRLMFAQMLMIPVIQLIILSSAATFEVKSARMYVVDLDGSETSRGLVNKLRGTGRFVMVGSAPSMQLANDAILSRDAGMILGIPRKFEEDLVRGRHGEVQIIMNAEDGATAGVTHSYAQQVINAYARELMEQSGVRGAQPVEIRARSWFNPELNYRDYMVPGLLVQLVTVVGTLLTAMNIVREKEIGTLEQLSVTPLSRQVFVAGKLIPLWMIALVEFTVGILIGRLLFHVPMEGSYWLLYLGAMIYLVAALGIGLFISTLVDTQQQAMFVTFFVVMVYLLMSGLFTPVRSMPDWAQWIAAVNPMKHVITLVRGIMLKGAGFAEVKNELLVLTAFAATFLTLAVRRHEKAV
jgi:ABC-2 type transport system permease protein